MSVYCSCFDFNKTDIFSPELSGTSVETKTKIELVDPIASPFFSPVRPYHGDNRKRTGDMRLSLEG